MSDPVLQFFESGGKAPPPPSGDAVLDFFESGAPERPAPRWEAKGRPAPGPTDRATKPVEEVVGSPLTGIGANIIGGWRGVTELVKGNGLEAAARAHEEEVNARTYQPETQEAQATLNAVGAPIAAARDMAGRGVEKVAEVTSKIPGPIGLPGRVAEALPGSARTLGEVAFDTAPVPPILKATKGAKVIPIREVVPEVRIEPTLSKPIAPEISSTEILQAEVNRANEVKKAATDWQKAQNDLTLALLKDSKPEIVDPLREKAAAAEKVYRELELVPQEPGRKRVEPVMAAEAPKPPIEAEEVPLRFLEGAPESSTPVEQTQRAKVLQRIGLEEVRESAVKGDKLAASTDYQTAKLDSDAGRYMKSVLEHEKEALRNYGEDIVRQTGGSIGTDSSALYARGNAIIAPLDDLKDYFDTAIKQLYREAGERAGDVPVSMEKTKNYIGGDQADFLGTTEGEALLKGVKARMGSLGMGDADKGPQQMTVKQAEELKQYLNDQWTPRTNRLIRKLKDSIDDDVMTAAGEDMYQAARSMRAMRGRVLDDPKGISRIMDADGPGGMNRKVDIEKIPDAVTGMSADQLGHIIKTLKDVPEPIKPQAEAALAEIKAQFANKILDTGMKHQGQWAARDVSKYLNANAERLKKVFAPEELDRINDLNTAGHILAKDQSYPGAAVQEHNLLQKGTMGIVRGSAAAAGGALGGAPGAAVGSWVGDLTAKTLGDKAALRNTQKRVIRLKDFPGMDK